MQRLIGLKDRFDVAFACDTDHDRHGVVTAGSGFPLMVTAEDANNNVVTGYTGTLTTGDFI